MFSRASCHDSLPQLLGYKIQDGTGEILMTHGGAPLEEWGVKIISMDSKTKFIISMLKHIILGLQKLHGLGYSHGDLKPANICARKGHDGKIKFTLIDLGMSSRLTLLG